MRSLEVLRSINTKFRGVLTLLRSWSCLIPEWFLAISARIYLTGAPTEEGDVHGSDLKKTKKKKIVAFCGKVISRFQGKVLYVLNQSMERMLFCLVNCIFHVHVNESDRDCLLSLSLYLPLKLFLFSFKLFVPSYFSIRFFCTIMVVINARN